MKAPSSAKEEKKMKNETAMEEEDETKEVVNKKESLMTMVIDFSTFDLQLHSFFQGDKHDENGETTFPALCQFFFKSTNEFLSEVPNITDSEESETDDDDDDFEIDDNIKSTNEVFESATPYDSEYIKDNKVHENSEKMKHIEEEKESPVL